jgi:hypothetical protein
MAVANSRRIVRFSLDLDVEQRNFLRLYALKNEINASIVMRAMIYILEIDPEFSNRVIDEIFMAPEVDSEELEAGILDEELEEELEEEVQA